MRQFHSTRFWRTARRCSLSSRSVARSASSRFPISNGSAPASSLQIIGISQDDAGSTQAFNQRFGVTFPTLLDPKDGYPASNAYGITNVPTLFLVEPDGQVANAIAGFSKRDLEALGKRAGVETFRRDENVPEWKAG